jgi:hypothetical protein
MAKNATPEKTDMAMVPAGPSDLASFTSRLTPEGLAAIFATHEVDIFVRFEEGEGFTGTLIGEGAPVEITNKASGEVKAAKSWLVEISGRGGKRRIRFLGTYELDAGLPKMVGARVLAVRGPEEKTGNGFRVARWLLAPAKESDPDVLWKR